MPIQADFILRRLSEMARADPGLRGRQPWKAAYERDYGWLAAVLAEHYAGNDANVRTLLAGVLGAYEGISVEEFEVKSGVFLRTAKHPALGRGYLQCAYVPMVELLGYLAANGFANYIASGGGRDFMRPISQEVYGIPRDRVIGSATTFQYTSDDHGGTITHKAGTIWPNEAVVATSLECALQPRKKQADDSGCGRSSSAQNVNATISAIGAPGFRLALGPGAQVTVQIDVGLSVQFRYGRA